MDKVFRFNVTGSCKVVALGETKEDARMELIDNPALYYEKEMLDDVFIDEGVEVTDEEIRNAVGNAKENESKPMMTKESLKKNPRKLTKSKEYLNQDKVEAHSKVSMHAYDKGVEHGKMFQNQDKEEQKNEYEICMGCGHEAKSHHGFVGWEKKDWGNCHKFPECKCKKFRSPDTDEKNPAHYCMGHGCDKYLGHRGFCSDKCHDETYDSLPDKSESVEEQSKKELHKDYEM